MRDRFAARLPQPERDAVIGSHAKYATTEYDGMVATTSSRTCQCYNVRTENRVLKGVFGDMGFVLRKYAKTGDNVLEGRRFAPVAPGAIQSPQQPGQLPDVSSVPERGVLPVPIPEEGPRRPATQYKTAEDLLHVWESTGKDVLDPDRFVQALPSYEEIRKEHPWKRKPVRPIPGYALSVSGSRLSEQLAALGAEAEEAPAE